MNNIILIGMPTSGKSTLGRLLAKLLEYSYLDTDDVIRQRTRHTLAQIIAQEGLSTFRQREEEAVCSVSAEHTVIATGGSVIYSPCAMAHLHSLGRLVYLSISYDMLLARIGDPHARGVAMPKDFTLLDLYQERAPLYERYADVTLEIGPKDTIPHTLTRLIKLLEL